MLSVVSPNRSTARAARTPFWRRAAVGLCLLGVAMSGPLAAQDPAQVNTFIGSKDDGNTYPGASAPFSLIQVSPIGAHYAGWRYDDPSIRGFGHSFLSGAGCWEQGGQVSVLPVTGRIGPGATSTPTTPRPSTRNATPRVTRMTAKWARQAITRCGSPITVASTPKPAR